MTSLGEFLLARLDEDAVAAVLMPPHPTFVDRVIDRDFLLADVEAKRAVVALHKFDPKLGADWVCAVKDGSPYADGWGDESWPCATLKALAQPHRDHPDFDPSWLT